MARTKITANLANQPSRDASPSHSSPTHSQTLGSTNSSGTPTPQASPISKRVPKPTEKVKEKDKGKGIATEPEKKKRKNPPTEKLLKDAMKSTRASNPSPPLKKKKKPSSSPDEDLSILLPSLESRTRYLADFGLRKIHDARIVNFDYFDANGFNFQDFLHHYNMGEFLTTNVEFYPRLIRVFYNNFKLYTDHFSTEIKGKKISMTHQEFSTFTKLPFYGREIDGRVDEESEEGAWELTYDRTTAIRELMVENFQETTSLPAGQMKVQYRLLLFVLSKILVPRQGNHVVVQQLDLTLLWGITQRLPMSWTWIVLAHMRDTFDKKGAMLPYPHLITRLLKKFKISLAGEEKVSNTHLFGEATINQMKLKRINDVWTRPEDVEPEPQLDQHAVLVKLTELMASQAEHNSKVELALADLQSRMGKIEQHLSLQMSFDDIAQVGKQASQDDPAPTEPETETAPKDLGVETLAEANTAASPTSSANRDA